MNASFQQPRTFPKGFSFIEVLLSLALVATAMVTLMALVPIGLKASRDATNSIIMGHILEDAHERMEGHVLIDGALNSKPFFYDDEGIYIAPVLPTKEDHASRIDKLTSESRAIRTSKRLSRRLYRVDIRLVSPKNEELKQNAPGLKAAIVTVTWPVNPVTGIVQASAYSSNRESITYYINTLTGPGWSVVDPTFEPLIEF